MAAVSNKDMALAVSVCHFCSSYVLRFSLFVTDVEAHKVITGLGGGDPGVLSRRSPRRGPKQTTRPSMEMAG